MAPEDEQACRYINLQARGLYHHTIGLMLQRDVMEFSRELDGLWVDVKSFLFCFEVRANLSCRDNTSGSSSALQAPQQSGGIIIRPYTPPLRSGQGN